MDHEAGELDKAEEVLCLELAARGYDAAIVSKRTSTRLASAACSGLVVADLGWAAWFGWRGAQSPRFSCLSRALCGSDIRTAALAITKVAKLVGNIRQLATQNPLLHHV